MLWLVMWLAVAAQSHARPRSDSANSSVFDGTRAGNYTFHISVDRLEVQNVNFNINLAVYLGGFAHRPAFQHPLEDQHKPWHPPLAPMTLGPEDYQRLAAPFVLPLPSRVTGRWDAGAAPAAGGLQGSTPPAPPLTHHSFGAPLPGHLSASPPQRQPPVPAHWSKITTNPPPQAPLFDTLPEEFTFAPPQYPVPVPDKEKLTTSSPPQYPDLETRSEKSETLQTW